MNGLENHLEINSTQKTEKTVKTKVKLPHVNKKPIAGKRIFCSTTAFLLFFKIRAKKVTPQNHALFRFISCFGVTKITTPI